MFTVYSAKEVEDLYYAVLTRMQVVENELGEAQDHMQGTLAEQHEHELTRLGLLRDHIHSHLKDHDHRFDVIQELFPEGY